MPELRQNLATREWVIIARERARRPEEFAHDRLDRRPDEPWRENCPFCPGHEEPHLAIAQFPEQGDWQVRVVRNKFPALVPDGEPTRSFEGVYRRIPGVGHHEVIIESRLHNTSPALQPPEELAQVIEALRRRGAALAQDSRTEHQIFFKNHGAAAGTSLRHPHAQLVSLPMVPYAIRCRTESARQYFDDVGRCVFCTMLEDELRSGERLVVETDAYVAFIPYAAYSPFHLWIVPRKHSASFLGITSHEVADLAVILGRVLRKLHRGLNDPDYNYVIRTAPVRDGGEQYLHWYISIVPRVSRLAGFEMGTGMFINPALPEESAQFLRAVVV